MNSLKEEQDQYLFFLVDGDLYAIEALIASEIVEYSDITKVPMMQSFVKGVTNIRGSIVPVIDMLDRFKLGKTKIADKTSIIVINYKDSNDIINQMGILIDEVYEVDNMDTTKATPEFGTKFDKKFISKMGKYDGNYIAILDVQKILDINELSKLGI